MSNTAIEGYIKKFAEELNGKTEITKDGLCGRAYMVYDFTLESPVGVDSLISVKALKHTEIFWCVGEHRVSVTVSNYFDTDTLCPKVKDCTYTFDFLGSDYFGFKAMVVGLVLRAARTFEDFEELQF